MTRGFKMLIYRCDKCGKEKTHSCIVGNEFDHIKDKFHSLSPKYRVEGITDLCDDCFTEYEKEIIKLNKEHDEKRTRSIKSLIKSFLGFKRSLT